MSNDAFLGEPFNIAFYALLTHCLAIILGVEVGTYTHAVVNHHIYLNSLEQVKEQLTRKPYELPKLVISEKATNLLKEKGVLAFDYLEVSDFSLENYQHHPKLTAPMAV